MLPILPIHGSSNKSTKKKRPRVLPQSSNKKKKASAPPVSGSASCSAAKPNVPSAASKSTTPAAVTGAAAAGITAESNSTKPSTDVKQPSSINNPTKAIANTAATTSPTSEIKSKEASAAIAALFKDEISSAAIPASKDAAAVAAIEAETTPPPSGKRNANASIGIHVLGSAGATKSATKPKAKPSFRPIAKATKHKPKAKANAKKIASKVPNPGSSTDAATTSANAMAASAASIKAGNHDEALVLAAEAAAALLEGEEGVDGMMVPMGLLEDVAPALEDGEQHIADDEVDMGDEHDLESPGNIHREEVDENKKSLRAGGALYHATNGEGDLEKHGENENVPDGDTQLESHNNGPLGPMSQVRSFETKFPQTAEVTPAHSNFLSYYYSNQAAEAHALEARRASRKKKSNSDGSDSDESDDSDDERSVVEEDSDEEEEDKVNEGTKSDDDDREKDETADGDNADQDGESVEGKVDREEKIEKVETVVTMRDFCSKYPKPDAKPGGRKKKQSDEDAGHNSDSEPREGEEATTNETNENNVNSSNSDEIQKEGDVEAKNAEDETGRNGDEDGVAVEADADGDETNNDGLQVEVIDGQIVVAESSLLANPENRKTTEQIDKEFGSVVEDDSSSQIGAIQAKYDSFLNVPRASNVRWSAEETKRFYHAMRQCGTDFSMMEMIMPGRKRAQLKKKFKVESRKNPRLVDLALDPRCKIKLDLSQFGQDLEIPDEIPPIRVTPSDSPSPGPSNSKKEEQSTAEFGRRPGSGLSNDNQNPFNGNNGGRGGQKSERAFDHLFNEENEEIVEEVVEDEESENLTTNENSRTKSVLSEVKDKPVSLSKSVSSVSKEKPKSNTASSATKSKPKEEGLSIVPLTPGMQKNSAKKKTRFKVKPKPSKKTGKK